MTTIQGKAIDQAKIDAALFVEEFGEPIDPATTDWDAEAYGEFSRSHPEQAEASDNDPWPIYQAALVAETIRLAAGETAD